MPKAYWIACYRSVADGDALARYAKLAGPLLLAGGGRFLARGTAAATFEGGDNQRCVLVEFDSVDQARSVYESAAYQQALDQMRGLVEREVRIVEGVE